MVPILDRSKKKETDNQVSDEDILNVLRESEESILRTSEIAEELSITQNWTGKRLNKLETKGRVHSKSAGRGRVWLLDDAEPETMLQRGSVI